MGKHDVRGHQLHISKHQKFNQPKPGSTEVSAIQRAPQAPRQGTTAQNHFK